MQAILAGLLRHGLTMLGGGTIAEGVASNDDVTAWAGALIALVGTAWSIWKNKK